MQKNIIFSLFIFLSTLFVLHPSLTFAQYNVSTFAGSDSGFVNAKLTDAEFSTAFGMCMDSSGNIYVTDAGNNCIRMIDTAGTVSTFAGTGIPGNDDGTTATATFYSPTGICSDNFGNFYVADFLNHTIRKIDSDGLVTTLAGSGQPGFADGYATEAQFNYPRGICVDAEGNLYVGDSWNHRIRKITPDGNVTTYAGGGDQIGTESEGSCINGPVATARFYTPCGVAVDNFGNVYVADALNHRIRKIDNFGNVTTVAGSGESGWDNGGFLDAEDTLAVLNTPTELFVTPDQNIIFSDTYGNRVRMVSNGQVTTIAGDGNAGYLNGDGSTAEFNTPRGIVMNSTNGNIYVFDSRNFRIRLISSEGN